MNECCKEIIKKFIHYYDDIGIIDLHGDLTAESELELFIQTIEPYCIICKKPLTKEEQETDLMEYCDSCSPLNQDEEDDCL
jgi:hypothetical protein